MKNVPPKYQVDAEINEHTNAHAPVMSTTSLNRRRLRLPFASPTNDSHVKANASAKKTRHNMKI